MFKSNILYITSYKYEKIEIGSVEGWFTLRVNNNYGEYNKAY